MIQNQCPVDLHPLHPVHVSTETDVKEAVLRARSAQSEWENLGLEKRARLMKSAAKRMLEYRQEAMELIHNENGKIPAEMLLSEIVGPLQYISDWTKVIRPWLKPRRLPISPLAFPGKKGVIDILPRGVIGIIAPWNYPMGNYFKPVFAALLCGNAVVVKPSEYAPLTAEWFVKMMNSSLPPNVLELVQGDRKIGQVLVQSGVDAVTFTGSYSSGREVARMAAEQMIPCSVELGGKDAAIVLADCEIDRTVAGIMHWSLHNAGQACGDIERVYVEEAIADVFLECLKKSVLSLRFQSGDPQNSDVGPTVHIQQLNTIQEHITDALEKGAKWVCGGKPTGKGLWFEPTILDNCDSTMKVMREPTFGPVIPICRVKNADEAVQQVNLCEYGLNASVWSKNERSATEIAKKLQVGTAFINNHAFTGAIPSAPWTGVKKTGYGIANSVFALQHYTRPRSIVIDRKKSADAWWLPMDSVAEDLGHRLAEAQLGNIFAALKIPFLISKRQRTVIQFVKQRTSADSYPPSQTKNGLSHSLKMKFFPRLNKIGKHLIPPLMERELTWGHIAINTIYTGESQKSLDLLSEDSTRVFLKDFYNHLPFLAKISLRIAFWTMGLAPIIKRRKWTTLDLLPPQERLALLEEFAQSDSYFQRQMILLFKMNGALFHIATSRFHETSHSI